MSLPWLGTRCTRAAQSMRRLNMAVPLCSPAFLGQRFPFIEDGFEVCGNEIGYAHGCSPSAWCGDFIYHSLIADGRDEVTGFLSLHVW